MKKTFFTIAMLLTFGLSFAGVSAQVDGIEAPAGLEAEDIKGLESAYDRTYSVDFEAMLASPGADLASLDTSALMRMVSIQGMTFDNEDSAKDYLKTSKDQLDEAMKSDDAASMGEIEITELKGFDVDGIVMTMDMADLGVGTAIIVFADGNQVFMVMSMDAEIESAMGVAEDITGFILNAETKNDDVSFNEDGTSTGGVYDRMPTADDELVVELTSITDSKLFPTEN